MPPASKKRHIKAVTKKEKKGLKLSEKKVNLPAMSDNKPKTEQQPVNETEAKLQLPKVVKSNRQRVKILPAKKGGHCLVLSHLPSGLGEPQLRRFIGQFGRVLRVRVPQSARTGNAKGVAFVELADPAAAKIAAETLDNYLMFTRLVRCKVLQDPKRLTFSKDGRKPRRASKSQSAATTISSAKRSRRLRTKVDRLKQLDPSFEFKR